MKLSQLIEQLERLKREHGDLPVRVQTISHRFPPEPVVKQHPLPHVLLNP